MTDKQLAMQCIRMLEKYINDAKNLPNNNTKNLRLDGADMTAWKQTYYPQLVANGKIRDGVFFENPLKNRNYGIGQDGECTKYEYVQFLWSAYKFVMGDFPADSDALKYIKDCIKMLEPCASSFENHGTETAAVHSLNPADKKKWVNEIYPKLSKSGLIPDGTFFGDIKADPRLGVGNDGEFTGEELCHFLFRLYRQGGIFLN